MSKKTKIIIAVILLIFVVISYQFFLQFKVSGHYSIDGTHIYYHLVENGQREGEILGADLISFKILNTYYSKDKSNVYYCTDTVKYADPRTFSIIDNVYSKDRNNVYVGSRSVNNVDLKTFEILDFGYSGYARDKNYVYRYGDIVEGADAETFKSLNRYYIKDKNHVYTDYGKIIKDADADSFKILNKTFAKDKNHIFALNVIIKEADLNSFEWLCCTNIPKTNSTQFFSIYSTA